MIVFILYLLAVLGSFMDLSEGKFIWAVLDLVFPIIGAVRCFR